MSDELEVRLDPLGLVCAIAYAAVVGYMLGRLAMARDERRKSELESIRRQLYELHEGLHRLENPPELEKVEAELVELEKAAKK